MNTKRIIVSLAIVLFSLSSSGCVLKVMHRTNAPLRATDRTLTFTTLTPTPIPTPTGTPPSSSTDSKTEVKIESFSFMNGKGHEFEDSLHFEALKHAFTAEYYATSWFDQLLCPESIGKGSLTGKWDEIKKKRSAEIDRLVTKYQDKYLKPEYVLNVRVNPLSLNLLGDDCKGATQTIRISSDDLRYWAGFCASEKVKETPDTIKTRYYAKIGSTTEMKECVGSYGFGTACMTVVYYAGHLLVGVPTLASNVILPYRWYRLADVDQLLPQMTEDDPARYANFAYYAKPEIKDSSGVITLLSPEQATKFRVSVELLRQSPVNERLDDLKARINKIKLAEEALGARYGEAGRKVGAVVDKRVKDTLNKRIKDDYYSDVTVFSGEKVFSHVSDVTETWRIHVTPNIPVNSTGVGDTPEVLVNKNHFGDKAENSFELSLKVSSLSK